MNRYSFLILSDFPKSHGTRSELMRLLDPAIHLFLRSTVCTNKVFPGSLGTSGLPSSLFCSSHFNLFEVEQVKMII